MSGWFIDGLITQVCDARQLAPDLGGVLDQATGLLTAHRDFLDTGGPGLVHGDFRPENLLVDAEGRLTAVIGWEAAKSGPPELDIGWWDCYSDTPQTPVDQLIQGHNRHRPLAPERLSTLRHLTVIRVMIGFFSWSQSVGDTSGTAQAAERLRREVDTARSWSAVG